MEGTPKLPETARSADYVAPWVDPVQVHEHWSATCDSCGWHTQPVSPRDVAREWARLHRVTCPLKTGGRTDG